MKLIKDDILTKIVADDGKHIRAVNDVYVPEHEEEGVLIPEHIPYYTELIYVPSTYTEEKMYENYVEEIKGDE